MGMDERKKMEKEIRRNDIIEAAERVIFAKGFNNSSMDDVAKAAEFSKRTLYVYFNSKEQLYFAIMVKGYRLLIDKLDHAFQTGTSGNALERIRKMGMTFYAFNVEHPDYFKAIMEYENGELDFEYSTSDKDKEECYALGEKVFTFLVNAIKDGIEEGVIKRDADVVKTALILWSCIIGVFNTANRKAKYLIKYHEVSPDVLIEESYDFLIKALQI